MVDNRRLYEVKSATIQLLGQLWEENFQSNRNRILRNPGVSVLMDKFGDLPAVLVGASPSLDKNLKYLDYAADRSVLTACDAVLKPLVDRGIRPSFVVNLDPQESVLKFFTGVDTRDLVLVAPTIAHPKLLDLWKGEIVFYNKYAPDIPILVRIAKQFEKIGYLIPGGTVLSVAFDLVFRIGCNPIIFTGQDLSFPGGQSHSSDTVYGSERTEAVLDSMGEDVVYHRDIFGRELPTLKSMYVTKQWLEWAFSSWKRTVPPKIYNCTEGGILSEHCEIAPLQEIIFRFCGNKVNLKWKIRKCLRTK
jgi:hypothetical protein